MADLQGLADRLVAEPSNRAMGNALMPLRADLPAGALSRRRGRQPTTGLELPAVRGRRDRIASPQEAATLDRHPAARQLRASARQ